MDELVARFGGPSVARLRATRDLKHIHELAKRTGQLQRLIVFGSYPTRKSDPNDVDVILVMNDSFSPENVPIESKGVFDHAVAQARFGASIFWIKPSIIIAESIDSFIAHWQRKRDGSLRGILEVE